jgi:Na+-transporting NADH:ubiquinone oxidoreductase subunit NqrC
MSELETMQKLLDIVLTRIEDVEDKIKTWKSKNSQSDPSAAMELRNMKKVLSAQQRAKITLIQSIQELTPGSNVMTIFTPLKGSGSFFSKLKSLFRA